MFPMTLDELGVLQPVDHPVHRRTRAPRGLLDFPAMYVSSVLICLKQHFKHVEGRGRDALDASHSR